MDTTVHAEPPVLALAEDERPSNECTAAPSEPNGPTVAESSTAPSKTPPTTVDDEEDEDDDDPLKSLERDHPSFEKATISMILQLLPEDGHHDGRLALVAVKSHNLAPLTRMHRLGMLGPLPDLLNQLMTEWQTKLPTALAERLQDRAKAKEREKAKEVERKAKQAATKTTITKKPDKSKPMSHATASSSSPAVAPTTPAAAEPQAQLF